MDKAFTHVPMEMEGWPCSIPSGACMVWDGIDDSYFILKSYSNYRFDLEFIHLL